MRISDIIKEDGSVGGTGAASVATVAMPLFGDKKMIRRAVDPFGYLSGKKKPKVAEKAESTHSHALPSMMDIGDNAGDLNKWSKAVAGHDGTKQTAPKVKGPGSFGDRGYAIGYSDVERKMASKAIGKTKTITSPGSKESSGTHKTSPINKDLR